MRHLSIIQPGSFLRLEGERLVIKRENQVVGEYPISRLKSLQIAARGIAMSSNLLYELALRGVNVFFIDYRSIPVITISGTHSHAVVELRKHQFEFANSSRVIELCQKIVLGKIRNQRSVLLYFSKQFKDSENAKNHTIIYKAISKIEESIQELKSTNLQNQKAWRERLMGYEGGCAQIYWNTLRETELLPPPFEYRKGRGASDVFNQALNFGYSLLMSYIWNAVIKSGLEPFLGFFHVTRPGKPSLVLDIMEEYRAWVVDRSVIKIRSLLVKHSSLNSEIKARLIQEVHETFAKRYVFFGKKLKLETLLQRQVYRLCGYLYGKQKYKSISFKW